MSPPASARSLCALTPASLSNRGSANSHRTDTDMSYFHPAEPLDLLPEGEFSMVRRLASGSGRDVFQYKWHRGGKSTETVVVKATKKVVVENLRKAEVNDRKAHMRQLLNVVDSEDALTEIGVLKLLSQQADTSKYIISLKDAFCTKSGDVWLVTEYADGGELFQTVSAAQTIGEWKVREYMSQLMRAIHCLHKNRIAHRDISLENILLKDGALRLMDFGLACRSHSGSGATLRYFRGVGKDFFRSPEVYVPHLKNVRVKAPPSATSGGISLVKTTGSYLSEVRWPAGVKPGQVCEAEVYGYAACPVDIFAAAICFFIMGFGSPPWNSAVLSDQLFAFAFGASDRGLERLVQHWEKPLMSPAAMDLLLDMTKWEPATRPSAALCLEHPWFQKGKECLESAKAAAGGS
eukprot:CAMPEP_0178413210 /NCGR_PEP_ID=MMETSP0689_2-20121128/22412_1 /TAXON_ID=160604 /ORGANISM="Amphidinium massartii, Strain CS-259" /LENGTH=406 /DNA_ID=CAMNT_0020034479 /DNA_START=17 /DNA_END=1233 /DNA_ORIENTATION=-